MLISCFRFINIFFIGVIAFDAVAVFGQNYPNKPIRILTSEPGGGNDLVARLIARGVSGGLGQPVIVDNRANAMIVGQTLAKAPSDGYTLLFYGSALWIGALMQKMPFDPIRDFSPVIISTNAPFILVIQPSSPARSVKELIAFAKARPGILNFSSAGPGTTPHLAGELFKAISHTNIVHVPYKGNGAALSAVIGNEAQLMFSAVPGAMPHVESGRLRALAVTSGEPSPLVPDLPTVAASGLPGYQVTTSHSIFAPAKTPKNIVDLLNREIGRFINATETKDTLSRAGLVAVGGSPDHLMAVMKSEMAQMGKVIEAAGLRTYE